MTDALTPARFGALADAYGGAISTWPETVRKEARRAAEQPWAAAILVEAAALDAKLDQWTIAPVPATLTARIAESAPSRARPWRAIRLWWSGLAAGAIAVGALTGSVAIAAVVPVAVAGSETSTVFGDLDLDHAP